MSKPGRVFGYARVSGAEQGRHGTSLAVQQDEIRRYCEYHRLVEPDLMSEVESAAIEKIERRRVLGKVVENALPGDTILVSRVDRWSRDLVHGVESVRALVKRGVGWISIGESIDASTSAGDSLLGLMAWAADNERKRIKERTVGRRKAMRDEGRYVEGPPPIGYRRERGGHLHIVSEESELVREVFRRCIAGESIAQLVKSVASDFGYLRDKKAIHIILRNRVYLGEVRTSRGEWIAAHEPIIDGATFRRAAASMASRKLSGRAPSAESHTSGWLLRDVARCAECGSGMSSAYRMGRSNNRYTFYYLCRARQTRRSCAAKYVRVDAAHDLAGDLVLERLRELREQLAAGPAVERKRPVARASTTRESIERKRVRLIDLAADGAIGRDDLRKRLSRLDEELSALEEHEYMATQKASLRSPEVRRELLRNVRELERAWSGASQQVRRAIVKRLAVAVDLSADRPPIPEWRTLEQLVNK